MRLLVTGCAGFLGSHLSERLVDAGEEVVGVDSFTDYYPREVKERNLERLRDHARFELFELDLGSDPLEGVFEGVETVFHLAAQPGVRGSFGASFARYAHDNMLATQRMLEAGAAAQVGTFVYASSSSVYGNSLAYPTPEDTRRAPVSPYGLTKLATEELAAVYGRLDRLHTVGLRYFTVYGPRQRPDMAFARFFASALSGKPVKILGDGSQVRDFTFVDDAVSGTIAAARNGHQGAVYNIGGGTQVELVEALAQIEELLDRKIEIEHLPAARGDVRRTCSDPRRAKVELGFAPRVSLEDGLKRQAAWMLAHTPDQRQRVAA
ncbi:MAG TPA: NAD-dependent epimerase/dehydratase family protein [Solirubrobacterales bacterium]